MVRYNIGGWNNQGEEGCTWNLEKLKKVVFLVEHTSFIFM